jgi:hypothetical protein
VPFAEGSTVVRRDTLGSRIWPAWRRQPDWPLPVLPDDALTESAPG